jgi:flagellar biosynthesis chaperone FliJ
MARTRTISSIETDIKQAQQALVKAKTRYDVATEQLKSLMEEKQQIQAQTIIKAFGKSGKSFSEIMIFLDASM